MEVTASAAAEGGEPAPAAPLAATEAVAAGEAEMGQVAAEAGASCGLGIPCLGGQLHNGSM